MKIFTYIDHFTHGGVNINNLWSEDAQSSSYTPYTRG